MIALDAALAALKAKGKLIAGGIILALVAVFALWHWNQVATVHRELATAKQELQKAQDELVVLRAKHLTLVRAAAKESKDFEDHANALVKEAQTARDNETTANRKLADALRRSDIRVLDTLPSFAAGNTTEAGDSLTTCRSRAESLGVLLDEAVRLGREAAEGAEQSGTDLRAVLAAWPRPVESSPGPVSVSQSSEEVDATRATNVSSMAVIVSVSSADSVGRKPAQTGVASGVVQPSHVAGLDSGLPSVGLPTP